jgi:hypothetical protein
MDMPLSAFTVGDFVRVVGRGCGAAGRCCKAPVPLPKYNESGYCTFEERATQ